jgi:hypothetical protein
MAAAAIAVLAAGILTLGVPGAASADESECLDTYLAEGGRELVQLDQAIVPPPLRGSGYDCASHIGDRTLEWSEGGSVGYALLYTDFAYADFIAILERFESAGWFGGNESVIVDLATNDAGTVTVGEAATLAEPPEFATVRFSNIVTGHNIIEMNWSDGADSSNDPSLTEPNLLIEVIVTERLDATGIADPSTLSTLRTIFQAAPDPTQWAVIGGGSVVLMLLVGWPSSLLNSVVGSRYQQLTMWARSKFRRDRKAPRPEVLEGGEDDGVASRASATDGVASRASATDTVASSASATEPPPASGRPKGSGLPGWLMWPGFALAAILGAFVDPAFGLNWMSLRVVLTLFVSFLLFNLAAWAVVRRVARRIQPDSQPYLRFRWGSLAIVAAAVLVARLLELQPGVIFGLVAGIAYAVTLQASRSAIITLVGSGFGLALAFLAWIAYSVLAPVSESGNAALVFLVEFLAGVTIKGVSSLPLSLLPIGTLDGAKVIKWKRAAWGVSYAVGLATFMVVLLTIPKSWGTIPGDFVRWITLFGLYALLAVATWAINAWRLKKRKPRPEAEQGDQPDALTID